MKKIALILSFSLITFTKVQSQTPQDSVCISTIRWSVTAIGQGIKLKQAQVKDLYKGTQNISIVEVCKQSKPYIFATHTPANKQLLETSKQAELFDAIVAINGTYFDMKNGGDVNFHKMTGVILHETDDSEFKIRAKGAFCTNDTIVSIIGWNKNVEKDSISHFQYKNILVSGPLLINNSQLVELENDPFVNKKHPRSCVAVTKDGTVLLIVFDGRHTDNAEGVNLHELAHFIKQIGAKNALNLDGGGSSTLYVKGIGENGVVNMPSDNKIFDHEGERKVSSIIYVN